jgi:hypothetical protein
VRKKKNKLRSSKATIAFIDGKERLLVLALCVMAAIRVFVFSAAFPFFNNVDEQAHFDLVVKYSRGHIPRSLDPLSAESAYYIARYGTPEFVVRPDQFPGGRFPPPIWTLPFERVRNIIESNETAWQTDINHEASQPPLYYALGGLWLRLGQWFGLEGEHLLYWIRFLNVFLIAGLVWLSFVTARMIFPERRCVRLGVPLLAAFLPQDTFYSVQSDVLSPLCFGVAFVCLARVLRDEVPSARVAVIAGLAVAATGLVKTSNLPLVAVAAVVVVFKVWRLIKAGRLRAASSRLALLALCAALPIGGWLAWNRFTFGDFTGSAQKIERLGWTLKPFSDWWQHPIFAPHGLGTFWSELMASFWRGEFVWHGQPLASPTVDAFYWISSAILIGLGVASLLARTDAIRPQRPALWFGFWSLAASIALLVVLSVAFDFGNCLAPSREHPYFTAGRLVSGALIPFLLLYVRGLDWALSRAGNDRPQLFVLVGIVLLMTISEIVVSSPAFYSKYNWFHL